MNKWTTFGVIGVALAIAFACGFYYGNCKSQVAAIAKNEHPSPAPVELVDNRSPLSQATQKILRTDVSEFPVLWENLKSTDGRRLLVARWIDLDFEGAKTFFSNLKHDKIGGVGGDFMIAFALANPNAALAFAKELPPPNSDYALPQMLTALASSEPALALSELLKSPHLLAFENITEAIIRGDPSLAPRILDAIENKNQFARLVGKWATVDQKAALAWVEQVKSPALRNSARRRIAESIAAADPEAAASLILEIDFEDDRRRESYVSNIAKRICDASDVETGVDWVLRHFPEEPHCDILRSLGRGGKARLSILDALPDGPTRVSLVRPFLMNWSDPDVGPAFDWIAENTPENDRVNAYGTIAGSLASRNFGAALRALDTIPSGPERDSYEMQLIIGQAKQGGRETGEAALEMIQQRYDETQVHDIVAGAFPEIAGLNAEAAAVFLDALPLQYRREHPSYQIANVWAKQDLEQAKAWVTDLPAGDGRENALSGLANELPPDTETAEWLNSLPPSTGKDKIARRLVRRSINSDQPSAFAWAQSIAADDLRADQLIDVVKRWAPDDPAAAATAIGNANISEREKHALALRLENQLNTTP